VGNVGTENLHRKIGDNNNLPEGISFISEGHGFLDVVLWFYLNSLSKILVCGADDIVFILALFLRLFVLLD
jgi:hypothetical protein